MNLNYLNSIGAEDKMLVIIRTKEIINYLLSFLMRECKGLSDENV